MRVVSFNVNGIRSRLHQLEAVVRDHDPDIIGLQETKVSDDLFPMEAIRSLGYDAVYHGQKGHYGVALLYRLPALATARGYPHDGEDAQRRLVSATLKTSRGPLHVFNAYFPQGENRDHPVKFPAKEAFYRHLAEHLEASHTARQLVLVMGDMNVAPLDKDIGIGEDNRKRWLRTGKTCFLPEEREWLDRLRSHGLEDTYEKAHPDPGQQRYSWFDYRSRGFEREPRRGLRIDLILASRPLIAHQTGAGIDHSIRAMTKPSDHCPVWVDLEL
jgi:exodeoxyribonuclease-3